jgi:site-specific DNA recombinase
MEMAVLFLRKSDENAEADDFDIQEDITRAYAESKGYGVYAVYREAHSGKHSPLTRTVLRQAINDIKSGHASVMVIRTYDRLARTIEQTYHIIYEVEQLYHGRIEAANEQLDRSSATAKIQFAVMAAASEMERDRIHERLAAGKQKRARRGHLTGGPNARYGYRYVDDVPGQRTAYAINPDTAPIVRRIFEQAGQGMALRAIARSLNVDGVPTPASYAASRQDTGTRRVGKYWQVEQLRSILKDSRYAGRAVLFRYKTERDEDTGKRSYTINEHPMPAPSEMWPAIVTEEMFSMAATRQQKQVAGRKPLIQALLRGHAYCALCGGTLSLTTIHGGKATVYRCRNRVPTDNLCPGVEIRQELLDEQGWDAIKYLLASREKFADLLRERYAPKHDYNAYLAGTGGVLNEKQEELRKLSESVGLSPNATVRQTLIERMEQVAEEVERLEKQHREAQRLAESGNATELWIQEVLDRIYGWANASRTAWDAPLSADGVVPTAEDAQRWLDTANSTITAHQEAIDALDALPFDMRRVAIEASGIVVKLHPVGSSERVEVSFDVPTSGMTIDTNASALVEVATPGRSR